jgi:hypothetical protein
MPIFSSRLPRLAVLALAVAVFCLLSPESLARGPDLCLWRNLFHLSACPACGTTRALAAFFHGQFAEALAFNRNVVGTAPTLLVLLFLDAYRALRSALSRPRSSLNSQPELNTVSNPQ